MQEAEISKDAFAPINFDLWKNVVHVAVADEAGMKSAITSCSSKQKLLAEI